MHSLLLLLLYLPSISANGFGAPKGMEEFLKHNNASGTENHLRINVTHAKIPHLPAVHGFMGTQATYRFLSVFKQTAWLVGEPKHGLWRFQQNGMIREWRKRGRMGIRPNIDPNDASISQVNKDIVNDNYAHFIPGEDNKAYFAPDLKISTGDGKYDDKKGYLNFIDLSIYHPKYKGRYDNHVPIDLPAYFCTVSQAKYPHAYNAWKYLVAQKGAGKMGPLAVRAGMDIKEQYLNVARFEFIHDANVWANVGSEDGLDPQTGKPNRSHTQRINYVKISHTKNKWESYLVERLFFNTPYLFVMFVLDNTQGPSEHSYIRPDGPYWNEVKKRFPTTTFNHNPLHQLKIYAEDWPTKGAHAPYIARGMPVYGQQNPERVRNQLYGGACPSRGGDWAHYPWGNSGAAYPTTYEETTPLCDALAMDIKMTHNLWVDTWNDAEVGLANAAYGKLEMPYYVDKNIYGVYTDPYLLRINATNPSKVDFTDDGKIVPHDPAPKKNQTFLNMGYVHHGKLIEYTPVKGLRTSETLCPTPKVPTLIPYGEPHNPPTTTTTTTTPTTTTTTTPTTTTTTTRPTCPPTPKCPVPIPEETYATEILIIACVSLAVLVIILLLVIGMLMIKAKGNQVNQVSGKTNAAVDA